MAAKSVSQNVTMSVGNVSLSFNDTSTSAVDPTPYVLGAQRVSTIESLTATGDIEATDHSVLLMIRNDNATSDSNPVSLAVALDGSSATYDIYIRPQQVNLITVHRLADVRVRSWGNSGSDTVDFTYLAVQLTTSV
jgi:hypothetical protein|tara:strand:+ start:718 stop:1125 length:408 start_codon:yes stop_codon:yes gene_type:complete